MRLRMFALEAGATRFWQQLGYAVTGTAQHRAHGREHTVLRMRKPLS